jgi:hypothetical protein
MYKVTVESRQMKYDTGDDGKQVALESWREESVITTASKKVLAGSLRSMADELDPPEKVYR